MNALLVRIYRPLSLVLAAVFAAVGLLFLLVPGGVVEFFNQLSVPLGMPPFPSALPDFFHVLAAAYMVVVTYLAVSMFRHPADAAYPKVLVVAKLSSAFLSLLFFFWQGLHLMWITNAVTDGLIGVVVLFAARR
jgi:hypothetical protein